MTDNSTLVSVITPAHNSDKFVKACIDSVVEQTYENWEQIIIDDGSTDDTAEIIQSYSDPRIKYCYQENRGIEALAHTYNRALREAKGDLIAILEDDDLWPAGKLAALVPAFQDAGTILAYGIPREINAEGRLCRRFPKQIRDRLKLPHSILFNDPVGSATAFMLRADGKELVSPPTAVIRRSALERINGFQYVPNLCTTDFPTFVRLTRVGKFHFTSEIMAYHRRHMSWSVRTADRVTEALPGLLSSLLSEFGSELNEKQHGAVQESWKAGKHMQAFGRGRTSLLQKEWRESRRHFRRALNLSALRVSCAAMVGWLLSWFHCTLEPLFRLGGRSSYRPGASN
jgi:glycosyltransferase involved in cell wall biosynthesis